MGGNSCLNLAPVCGLSAGCISTAGGGRSGALRSGQAGVVALQPVSKIASSGASTRQGFVRVMFLLPVPGNLVDEAALEGLPALHFGLEARFHRRQPQAVTVPRAHLQPYADEGSEQRRSCEAVGGQARAHALRPFQKPMAATPAPMMMVNIA